MTRSKQVQVQHPFQDWGRFTISILHNLGLHARAQFLSDQDFGCNGQPVSVTNDTEKRSIGHLNQVNPNHVRSTAINSIKVMFFGWLRTPLADKVLQ